MFLFKTTLVHQRDIVLRWISKMLLWKVHTYQKLCPHFVMCASSIISKQIGLEEQKKSSKLGQHDKRQSSENSPNKIVAFIFVWIQQAIVKGSLMVGFLSAARRPGGSAERSEPAPGRRHGGQSWHRQAAGCCQGPGGHNSSRVVTVTDDGVAPTAVWVAGAAACAGHRTRPTSALLWPVAWHHFKPTRNASKSAVDAQSIRTVRQLGYLCRMAS